MVLLQALQYCEVIAGIVALDYDLHSVVFIQDLLSVARQLRTLCACKNKQLIGNETEDTDTVPAGIDLLKALHHVSM